MQLIRCLVCVLPLVGALGCSDDCKDDEPCGGSRAIPTAPSPTSPTPTSPVPAVNTFEFRVLGSVGAKVDIRYVTTQEGTTILSSQVPWTTTVRTTDAASFLSLAARAPVSLDLEETVLQVQILVNGRVFREASEEGIEPELLVSGLFGTP